MKKLLKRLTALSLVLSMTMSLLCGTAWAKELAEKTVDFAEASMVEPEDEPTEDVADEPESEPEEESEGEDVVQTLEAKVLYSGTCGEKLTWTLSDDSVLTISGSGAMKNYDQGDVPWCNYKIKKIIIKEDVTSIGDWAFEDCSTLTSITIPNSVTSIGDWAFSDCSSLSSITIPKSVTSIGNNVFSGCSNLTSIAVDSKNSTYSSKNGVLYNKKQTVLICCPGGKSGTFTIPNSVTSIGYSAFEWCTSLTSVTIPSNVTSIGDCAFGGCEGLTNITIPNSVTSIGDCVFAYCNSLTSITIPKSVTSIGDYAFYDCNSLKNVYYSGSKSNWSKISIGSDNTCLTNATIHYNSSGSKTALSKATVTLSKTKVVYTGKAQKPTVTVKVNGVTVPSSQYTVSYSNNTKVGTAKVTIKATSKATYISGSVTKTFTITKATNPLTVSPTSKKLTVAKCKKKAQTFTIKVSKAQGTVSYKSSNTKYVTVSKGKVTVKKGTPKGTYKVTVTAKGNGNYKSGSKTVTITVK